MFGKNSNFQVTISSIDHYLNLIALFVHDLLTPVCGYSLLMQITLQNGHSFHRFDFRDSCVLRTILLVFSSGLTFLFQLAFLGGSHWKKRIWSAELERNFLGIFLVLLSGRRENPLLEWSTLDLSILKEIHMVNFPTWLQS